MADLGDLTQAALNYKKALSLNYQSSQSWSNYLYTINQIASIDWEEKLEEAKTFGMTFAGLSKFASSRVINSFKKLRVGLVSGDFREHPVGYFLEAVLSKLNKEKIELISYPTNPAEDDLTRRIRPQFSEWNPLFQYLDEEAKKIYDDRIDILFDLSGHTQFNRLPVFSWKPARVQVTWLGYFASTGIQEIDYILADKYVAPVTEEKHFTEKVWRMPNSYLCFTPPLAKLEVDDIPATREGFVTFGCFNSMIKITTEVMLVWSKIMLALPDSKLFLKTKVLSSNKVKERVIENFSRLGVGRTRLILEGWSPRAELLKSYQRVDITLDPFLILEEQLAQSHYGWGFQF